MATETKKGMIPVYGSCQEPDLAPVNQTCMIFCLSELPGTRTSSGEPKMNEVGLSELPGARPSSGEPKLNEVGTGEAKLLDFRLSELQGARPGSGEQKMHDYG